MLIHLQNICKTDIYPNKKGTQILEVPFFYDGKFFHFIR